MLGVPHGGPSLLFGKLLLLRIFQCDIIFYPTISSPTPSLCLPSYYSVRCEDGDLRLEGGLSEYEGRLEVCNDESWGTVCDDGWVQSASQVACRQMNFNETVNGECNNRLWVYCSPNKAVQV